MSDPGDGTRLAGVGAATAAGLIWGLAFVLPELLPGWSPVAVTAGRYLAYGMVSLVLFALGGRRLWRLTLRHWRPALAFALTGNVLYYLLLVVGIDLVGAPATDIIVGCIPVAVALVGNVLSRGHRWRELALPVVLVVIGLAIVNVLELGDAAPTGSASPATKALGVLAAFGAVALWTWYALANTRFLNRHPDVPGGGWATIVGLGTGAVTLAALPLAAVTGQLSPAAPAQGPSAGFASFVLISVVLGVLVSWAATGLWNAASARLPATVSGMLITIETVSGFTYVYAARGDWPPPGQLAGFAVILAGVLLVVRLPAAVDRHSATPAVRRPRRSPAGRS